MLRYVYLNDKNFARWLKMTMSIMANFQCQKYRFKRHSKIEDQNSTLSRRLLWLIYFDPRKKKKKKILFLLKPETYFISSLTLPPESISFVHVLIIQSCPTLCNPMDCCLPGSSVHGILQARRRVGCHAFLQGIFLTQGSNPGLLQFGQILYCLRHQGSPGLSLLPT